MFFLKKIVLMGLTLGLLVIGSTAVQAQGIKDQGMLKSIASKAGVAEQNNVESVASTVIKAVLSVTGLIFLVLMVYAGMLWMTARGDEGQVDKAMEIIKAAIIGLAVTISAYAITVFVTSRFSSSGPSLYCKVTDATDSIRCVPAPAGTSDCGSFATENAYTSGVGPFKDEASCNL